MQSVQEREEAFLSWLLEDVVQEARGDSYDRLTVGPSGRFWMGRLAPEEVVQNNPLGERAERLIPCASGFRVRPTSLDGRTLVCTVQLVAWKELPGHGDAPEDDKWEKTECIVVDVELRTPVHVGEMSKAGRAEVARALTSVGADGLAAEIQAEIETGQLGPELVVTVVNVSPEDVPGLDSNLYEVKLTAQVGPTYAFVLDSLPDSFRYDRRVPAYGVNGGVDQTGPDLFTTVDFAYRDRNRPDYSDDSAVPVPPRLTFGQLATDPLPSLSALVDSLESWTDENWGKALLDSRVVKEGWTEEMKREASNESERARTEVARLREGLDLLRNDSDLLRAFSLANEAFKRTVSIEYDSWRLFQVGFVLANVASLASPTAERERRFLDTLWFATGGGKTETYLLYTLTAAFFDRLRGKLCGISSWGRFPLRMLSLQQTQRFADVLAAAELVRRQEGLPGEMFALGFFVGNAGSPNSIVKQGPSTRDYQVTSADLRTPEVRRRYQILINCPFCGARNPQVVFDEDRWALQHRCLSEECVWQGAPLPFYIVDEEIYRWLPTVVLGTLDKAANVSMQASMRGFYGPPSGICPEIGHGFTYVPRSGRPHGCLFPDCRSQSLDLPQPPSLFGPTVRMQDELHLLKDSLGAIDSHYEALLDDLQNHWGSSPKIIASSATLAGHEEQVKTLYRREGRMFPIPGPTANRSFWTQESDRLARRYVGLAPRGVTIEYANDQLTTTLQRAMRRALQRPNEVASATGIPAGVVQNLVLAYGTSVTYGSTLKDVEAAARSFQSEIPIDDLNSVTLTGRTPLEEVRTIIDRLKEPEREFGERIHMIAASSMLSHGVDLDRLNVMVMLGLPLSTSEFIQTTSRVGRLHPGLVFVLHKIARERDAAVFRTFSSFIRHMDRLVDPVPITSKSRRVLELTFSGLELARILGIHEPAAIDANMRQLTTVASLRQAFTKLRINEPDELEAMIRTLGFEGPLGANLREDLKTYYREFYRALNDPAGIARWPSELFPGGGPMRSLRDVETQIPVSSRGN